MIASTPDPDIVFRDLNGGTVVDPVLYDKVRAVEWRDGVVRLLDQRVLPGTLRYEECATAPEVATAITNMVVRGAPAIGVTAAYGAVLAVTTAYARAPGDWRTAVRADLLIGAVLVAGARAPHVVTRPMVRTMRRGAVIVDIAIDQGGCVETMHATDYGAPTYIEEGVVHFGVTNMPGAVPRTASQALSAVLLPYVQVLAAHGADDPRLAGGVNVRGGRITHEAVAAAMMS